MDAGERKQSVLSIIHTMRNGGSAVNFIDADGPIVAAAPIIQQQSVTQKLDTLIKQADQYQWRLIDQRFVLYPSNPIWRRPITGVKIRNTPRLEATDQYIALVKQQVPQLNKLIEPVQKGDPEARAYVELVTLSHEAPLLEHLVELLGDYRQLVFTVQPIHSGQHLLVYDVAGEKKTETDIFVRKK